MKQVATIYTILEDFMSIIYPNVCVNCETPLFRHEKELCTLCKVSLPLFELSESDIIFLESKFSYEPKVRAVKSLITYRVKGMGQKLIHELKYKGNQSIGKILGERFAKDIQNDVSEYDLVIPIPLHKRKLASRGYNQAAIIAEAMAIELGMEFIPEGLIRTTFTKTQTKKGKVDRWKNMVAPFKCNEKYDLQNRRVMLVDDVITTGATISAAVEVLVAAGVSSIGVFTLAAAKK